MQPALHRTVLVVDVAGFGDRRRTNQHQVTVRAGLYSALRHALDGIGIAWADCYHEDRGDGVLVLAPSESPKAVLVESFPQRLVEALRDHNEGRAPEEQIRLRLALHAGEVHYDEHGVTGASINLAFRLLNASRLKSTLAGSLGVLAVIVSSWFFEDVVRHSVASKPATYRQVRVKNKETNTSAWICLPDQPFSPPVARAVRAGNGSVGRAAARPPKGEDREPTLAGVEITQTLPHDTTAFTGRADELDTLLESATEATETGQVVAIHAIDGMAGVGKTALAIHVAHRLEDRFPDGRLFVRLHAHTPGQHPADPAEVLASLLSAAGVPTQRIPAELDARAAMWRNHLVGKKILLFLDDAAGHQQVEPLLPATPGCLVLVTSRRRLTALDTVVTLPLDTLPPDEAVALFTRLSGRTVAAADGPHVAEIVQLSGCLPLAISLVAGRLRHRRSWSVADLAEDLNLTRDRLFEIRAEDVAVAAAFDLSFRDLPDKEQLFFRYLGTHPGPELDAYGAAALADVPLTEAREYLEALYNNHLLDEPAPKRYRMHDLVRDYTRRLTDGAGDEGEAVERLFEYYQRTAQVAENYIYGKILADELTAQSFGRVTRDFSTHAEAMAWMHTERANLVACVEYAARQGQRRELRELEDALTSLLLAIGPWHQPVLFQQSAHAGQLGDEPLSLAYSLNRLGEQQKSSGKFADSVRAHSKALAIYSELNLPDLRKRMANTLSFMGVAQLVIGDLEGAIESQTQALEIFRSLDYPLAEAYALNELGVVRRVVGNFDAAAAAHAQAFEIFDDVGGDFGKAFALVGLGAVRRATGNYADAIESQQQALEIYGALGSQVGEADALNELGSAVGATGDFAAADALHARALAIYRDSEHSLGQAETLNNNGRLLLEFGKPAEARARHESAVRLARDVRSLLEEARALEGLAWCGDEDDAVVRLRDAVSIYRRIGAAEADATADRLAELEAGGRPPRAVGDGE
jgi:tetratricopeptide (TPR) repeat protein